VNPPLKISDLALRTHCPPQTIRYYEREGLLPQPMRSIGNYRLYGLAHVDRLVFIRNCRSLDMTLDEIRELLRIRDLPRESCDAAHALLDEHIAHVATRIEELQLLERQLKGLRRQCVPARDLKACGILDELGQRTTKGVDKKPAAHVRGTHRA
jgi:Cd(II)/Pb(II)-responsive transcriptional regulator